VLSFQHRQISLVLPNSSAFNTRRMILPLRVFGRLGTKVISSGTAREAISVFTCCLISLMSSSLAATPGFNTMNAFIRSPFISSGLPMTADSRDRGVGDQRVFHFRAADAVAGHVHYVVAAAQDLDVAVFVLYPRRSPLK